MPPCYPPFIADANTIPVYNAGRSFWRRHVRDGDDRSDWFGVAPGVPREMIAERDRRAADDEGPFTFGWTRADAQVYLEQRRIYSYVRDTPEPDRLLVEEGVITMASRILAEAYRDAGTDGARLSADRRLLVERTREHLAASFATNLSLERLARDVGASVFHLCRVFKAQTGATIHQYRTQLRIRHSLEMLESNPGDILSTALDLGFSGHSHYTRTFHDAFGLPPSVFTDEVAGLKR